MKIIVWKEWKLNRVKNKIARAKCKLLTSVLRRCHKIIALPKYEAMSLWDIVQGYWIKQDLSIFILYHKFDLLDCLKWKSEWISEIKNRLAMINNEWFKIYSQPIKKNQSNLYKRSFFWKKQTLFQNTQIAHLQLIANQKRRCSAEDFLLTIFFR